MMAAGRNVRPTARTPEFTQCPGRLEWPTPAGAIHILAAREAGKVMERADWLDGGLKPADARFLMMTAITHHRVNSRIWGQREVHKLHAELAEIEWLAVRVIAEHNQSSWARQRRGAFGAPA
jgi:hypothetical protein